MQLPSPILVVCQGNLCRSPFAALLLEKKLQDSGTYAEVFSRGLQNIGSQPVPEAALSAAREFDIDMATHRSSMILKQDLQHAAFVLVMSSRQRKFIGEISPVSIGKVFLLSQLDGGDTVADPIGQPTGIFREVYSEINEHIDAWLQRFGVIQA
jgi:protein-tyrosine phosphatase